MEQLRRSKNFVIVGASSGIGRATALELCRSGANILAIGRNLSRLKDLEMNLNPIETSRIFVEQIDVLEANEEIWRSILEKFTRRVGKLDGGVYTAGIWGLTPLRAFDKELARRIFDTSFWGAVDFLQSVTRQKISLKGASFVIMSSVAATFPGKSLFAYSAAKAAIQTAIKSFAQEVARNGYRINSIAPGFVNTEMLTNAPYNEQNYSRQLLGLGNVEDVTGMILFLLSERATWITGQNFFVDGGYSIGNN